MVNILREKAKKLRIKENISPIIYGLYDDYENFQRKVKQPFLNVSPMSLYTDIENSDGEIE